MKRTLLITLLLIPFIAFSQTTKPIDGFLGIKFGSSKAAVVAAMRTRGATLNQETKSGMLIFENVSLGHRQALSLMVKFVNNKAYEADFVFSPDDRTKIVEYYDNLTSDINGIYGDGTPTRNFTSPYADGDGNEYNALKSGNAEFNTLWVSAIKNAIKIEIQTTSTDIYIMLIYQDSVLARQAVNQQKRTDSKDF